MCWSEYSTCFLAWTRLEGKVRSTFIAFLTQPNKRLKNESVYDPTKQKIEKRKLMTWWRQFEKNKFNKNEKDTSQSLSLYRDKI